MLCSLACGMICGGEMCDSVSVIANNCIACIICLSKESLVSFFFVLYHVLFFCYSENFIPKIWLVTLLLTHKR